MCGIFGVFNAKDAARLARKGLHANQHRAVDYAGIVTSDGYNLRDEYGTGIAREVFDEEKLGHLLGIHALGHIRYPTTQDNKSLRNIQPIRGNWGGTSFALAHNGNLPDTTGLHAELGHRPMLTSMDTESILRLIEASYTGNLEKDLASVFLHINMMGSFALGLLFPDRLIAVQDSSNCRPLSLGCAGESYFFSSETSAFGGVKARHVKDIPPGEMVIIGPDGPSTIPFAPAQEHRCIFELNYFSLPTSVVFGEQVSDYRVRLGVALEECCPTPEADIITAVPDSANFIAQGYSKSGRSGVLDQVIIRNHYTGRTFIEKTQSMRDAAVDEKFLFNASRIEGKSIAVVDDSIVRSTTIRNIVQELRWYGAREVHVRIATPPITDPCLYGINTPTKAELISANNSTEEIQRKIGADSLAFLPLEALQVLSRKPKKFCFSCMTGQYWHKQAEALH